MSDTDHLERIRKGWPDEALYEFDDALLDVHPEFVKESRSDAALADELLRSLGKQYCGGYLNAYDDQDGAVLPLCPRCEYRTVQLEDDSVACTNHLCQSRFDVILTRAGESDE